MNDFALINWIKKDQEERRQHITKMAIKNFDNDELYVTHIADLVTHSWKAMKPKDRMFLCTLMRWRKQEGKCFTTSQRSAIMSMYMKYILK